MNCNLYQFLPYRPSINNCECIHCLSPKRPIDPDECINRLLPEDCLIAVLARVPLNDVFLNVNLVCHYWHSIIVPAALRTKRHLLIACKRPVLWPHFDVIDWDFPPLEPDPEKTLDRADCLLINTAPFGPELRPEQAEHLASKLPNIRRLDIRDYGEMNAAVEHLVAGWPHQLLALKIVIRQSLHSISTNSHSKKFLKEKWNSLLSIIHNCYSDSLQSLIVYDNFGSQVNFSGSGLPHLHSLTLGLYTGSAYRHIKTGNQLSLAELWDISYPKLRRLALIHPPAELDNDSEWSRGVPLKQILTLEHQFQDDVNCIKTTKFLHQLTHFVSDIPMENVDPIEQLQQRLCSRNLSSLISVSFTTHSTLQDFLTRSGLHRLPSLCHLSIFYLSFESWNQLPPLAEDEIVRYESLESLEISAADHCEFGEWAVGVLPRLQRVSIRARVRSYRLDCGMCACQKMCNDREWTMLRSLHCLPSLEQVNHRGRRLSRPELIANVQDLSSSDPKLLECLADLIPCNEIQSHLRQY